MTENQTLYAASLDGAEFTRLCGGNLTSDNESCVEIAPIPGVEDAFALRDSKVEGGPVLRFTGEELRTFVAGAGAVVGA